MGEISKNSGRIDKNKEGVDGLQQDLAETEDKIKTNAEKLAKNEEEIENISTIKKDFEKSQSTVLFTAEQGFSNSSLKGWIAFKKADLNAGNGMNITDGRFRVPISGVYEFTVSSQSRSGSGNATLDFYKNNHRIVGLGHNNDHRRIGWVHQLNKGDIIRLRSTNIYQINQFQGSEHYYSIVTLFSGLLIHSNGTDECADGFYGPNCNECSPGYFGYPNCRSKLS